MALEKTYQPAAAEAKWYPRWEQSGAFACDPASKKEPFCIMMPPPNVTGSLHIGHALTFTLQDILIRFHRMRGKDVLWQPGTDHAGIATQMIVEKQLVAKGEDRRAMGREAFLKKVWQWKEESGGTITRQLRRLGASPDWARERFTMDEGCNKAVTKVFVQLYKEGLIYKDKRLVNWDPALLTAVSDLEVVQKEVNGNLWHIKYPLADNPEQFLVIATTRPETMFGDTAVAVHPDDDRYRSFIGKTVRIPVVGREVPVIADVHVDKDMGTGALKVTPAHDFNDFEIGKRHGLPMPNIFDQFAKLNDAAGAAYRGMDRFAARKKLLAELEEIGALEKVDQHKHVVPHGDRSGVVIEPWLSEQWYVNTAVLAAPALKAVEEGKTKFVPQQWENTYFAWLRDIQPWCISRQLWWGHQIPAWYGPDGKFFVAENETEAQAEADKHYGKRTQLKRDEDVLDTWFSSGLWPFSTLNWPQQTPELKKYYPTSVLITGFDIIFFWVARMMMMGIYVMKKVPFKTVYIHGLVRDEKGQKMSKTKGNVIDPLAIIDDFGCDALRMTLAAMAASGRDVKLSEQRIEGYRNFVTKIWNAARYCEMNQCVAQSNFTPGKATHVLNKWVIGAVRQASLEVAEHLENFRYDLAANTAYSFVWNTICDWYLEFTKPLLSGDDEAVKAEIRATTAWVLQQMLHLLHPFMPFVTEELWEHLGDKDLLITRGWPDAEAIPLDKAASNEMNLVIQAISAVRSVRAELNVPASAQIPLHIREASAEQKAMIARHQAVILRMARLSGIDYVAQAQKGSAQDVVAGMTLILPLADVIDLEQERARLAKESQKLAGEIQKIASKLSNDDFVAKAPPEVVDEQRERKTEAEATLARLEAAQRSLAE